MKTFYVLFDGDRYLCKEDVSSIWYSFFMDNALKLESLHQAHVFMQENDLELEIHRVDITPIVYDLNQNDVLPEN